MSSLIINGNNTYLYWKNVNSFPTLYRALYIFSQYVHLKNKSFLIHGAGLKEKNQGYIFAGHSGSGKTTIAQKTPKENLLNDEAVAIKRVKNYYYAKSTPFGTYYSNFQKLIKVKAIILLRPSNKTSIWGINYPNSISQIQTHIPFLYNFKNTLRKRTFFLLSELCKNVPVFYAELTLHADIKNIIKLVSR